MRTKQVGIEPILDKHDIILGYRLLEPLRRPCVTCGHEADYGGNVYSMSNELFDRWSYLQQELLSVNMKIAQIYPSSFRLYTNINTGSRTNAY